MGTERFEELLPPSLHTGFIDHTQPSNELYRPSLVLNDPPRSKVLHTLCRELENCSYFEFSVAFITSGGIMMLLQALYEAKAKGITGKILTSDYLGFTDPKALALIRERFDNIELRVYSGKPFHAKGYLFYYGKSDYASLMIGSSNLTHEALATNREWNIRLVSLHAGDLLRKVRTEFNAAWDMAHEVSPAWLLHYERIRASMHRQSQPASTVLPDEEESFSREHIVANTMQRDALASLQRLRQRGENKAILVSATGSGKTFLSAFDVQRFAPRRFLFIVHRQQIASESMRKFKRILGNSISCSLIGGGTEYDKSAVYLFSMIQTLSKDEVLRSFAPDEFDYIVVDEVHRAGAASYEKVLSYFTPKFLLGMTATPERTDGYDIYRLFDNNIAYEIRLNQALEADLLCPFHYYGISDLVVDEVQYDDLSQFSKITSDEWVRNIQDAINRYSIPDTRRRGLIFVSRNEEGKILSEKLNLLGLRTLALSGADDDKARDAAFDRLELADGPNALDYLIAVDILNEGIDIPSLNQIIMLRPTQSAIVFVQQMGRGLRKYQGKDFLTVIDFIGNYTNNYMIPVALFGDTSFKKDTLRKLVSSGSLGIHGVSTVNFDRIAKERIYKAINDVSFRTLKFLKDEYNRVKMKIGGIPTMMDFVDHGAVSPLLFIDHSKNYYQFKSKVEKPFVPELSADHLRSLDFFSKVIAPGIRPYEAEIVEALIAGDGSLTMEQLAIRIEEKYNFTPQEKSLHSAVKILQDGFYQAAMRKSFGNIVYCSWDGDKLVPTERFKLLLEKEPYRQEITDILNLGNKEYRTNVLPHRMPDDLMLYHKYSRQDVCRLLNWDKDESSTIYGYKVDKRSMTCPIFVTYHKNIEEIDPSINYHDHFKSPEEFAWETRHSVKLGSSEPKAIRNEEGPMRKLLFVQKNNDEGIAFYYMGSMEFLSNTQGKKETGKSKELPVVAMEFAMHTPVPADLYDYITG